MKTRWIIGDIHGCINTLTQLVETEISPSPDDTIFCLGDLIDRGPGSKAVLDYLLSLRELVADVRVVRGNHEVMMLDAMKSEEKIPLWMMNGGGKTLASFGVEHALLSCPEGISQIPGRYMDFLEEMPWYLETAGLFLVHAGLNPILDDPLSDPDSMIWARHEEYNAPFLRGRKLVHGHSPRPLDFILRRLEDRGTMVFNLDGGCVYGNSYGLGYLIAWNPDTSTVKYVKNKEK